MGERMRKLWTDMIIQAFASRNQDFIGKLNADESGV
jgi:hypothetical protein